MVESDFNVLIVDDIYDNIQLISSILEINDIDVKYATNGKQALEMAVLLLPDLILLDVSMPEMDGFDVCSKLKSNDKTKEIPVIFLTARVEAEDILRGFDVGAIDYVTKPYNTSELLSRVMTQLNLKKSQDIIKQQNKELKNLSLTKDRFFSIVAKDLRNPFEMIRNTTAALLRTVNSMPVADITKSLTEMHESSKLGFNTLENLLEWSKLQMGDVTLFVEKIDLNVLLDSLISQLRSIANRNDILLYKSTLPNTIVSADRETITYVLKSLIMNALSVTPAGGDVVISAIDTKNISVDMKMSVAKNGYVQISVSDSGTGIRMEDVPKVFDLEFASLPSAKNETRNDTLNLLLSKAYIEKNKGRIWVDSVYGKGSEFKFTLPKPDL